MSYPDLLQILLFLLVAAIFFLLGLSLGKSIAFAEAAEHLRSETQPSPGLAKMMRITESHDLCDACGCPRETHYTPYGLEDCVCACHIRTRVDLHARQSEPLTPPPEPLY